MEREPLPLEDTEQEKINPISIPSSVQNEHLSSPQNSVHPSEVPLLVPSNTTNSSIYNNNNNPISDKCTPVNSTSLVYNLAPTTFENLKNKSSECSTNLVFPPSSHCNFTSEHPMLQFLKMSFVNSGMQQNPASFHYWKDQFSKLGTPIHSAAMEESMSNSPIPSAVKTEVKRELKQASSAEQKVISSSTSNVANSSKYADVNSSKEAALKQDSGAPDQEANSKKKEIYKKGLSTLQKGSYILFR